MAKSYEMLFDIGTIKHLGLQMYSTLPPVIGELVSNAWDADAKGVEITIPTDQISISSEIVVQDTGAGMTEDEVKNAYLIVGRDRRKADGKDQTSQKRPIMGRKGIGKFSAFGIANEIEIETTKDGQTTRFIMNYLELEKNAKQRKITLPSLPASGTLKKGTKVTLRHITRFKNRSIGIQAIRRGIARRFSVAFMRDYSGKTTDPEVGHRKVVGYLLCGDLVNTYQVRQRTENLKNNDIFVRKYTDLLAMVKSIHKEFLARYDRLRSARKKS